MDYEKMYNEALERARKIHSEIVNNEIIGFPGQIETIFPELAESEDERIIKLIRSLLENVRNVQSNTSLYKQYDDALAWLEKQKEQKPAEYLDNDKVYAIMTKLTILSYSQLIPINSDEFKKIHEITSDVRDLLDYPIEQKPTSISCGHENDAEWSEEDKEALDMCLDAIPKAWKTKSGILLTKWLKDNIHLQPKQEWSEEDEKMLRTIISDGSRGVELDSKQISWLKSLRPQPSWKPSDMNTNCEGCLYWTGKCKLPKGLDCPGRKEKQK